MKLKRNDPCYCGSNKKYKNCCWTKDRKPGKEIKIDPHRIKAIAKIRRDPRGRTHWISTNAIIDEILKKKLKNAPVLKYNSEAWIRPLYTSYFILRSDYWRIIYDTLIKESNRSFDWLLNRITLETPTYLRIISLLLRITFDRLGISEYDNLPKLPINYAMQPEFGSSPFFSFGTEQGIFKYIDEITNNASREICNFFFEARDNKKERGESISGNVLFPIPFYELPEYIEFIKKSKEKFSQSLTKKEREQKMPAKDQDGKQINLYSYTPPVASAIADPVFKKRFLPYLVEYIRKIYGRLASEDERLGVFEICNFFYYFFKNAPFNPNTPQYQYEITLETLLLLEGISEDLLHRFLYDIESEDVSLANPLKSGVPLFYHSLDLFEKPFIKDRFGRVFYSLFWLFDALLYKLTKLLRQYNLGLRRGQRAENYISYLIEQFITEHYPKSPFIGPFKIILKNANKTSKRYRILKDSLKEYKFPVREILIPDQIYTIRSFIEVDAAFIFHNTLFLIEVKDDLFWNTRDLSDIIILWGRKINQIAKRIQKIFESYNVKSYLNNNGINYDKVCSYVISQNNINHPEFQHIADLYQELSQLNHNITTGKDERIISFIFPSYPPYPWKIEES